MTRLWTSTMIALTVFALASMSGRNNRNASMNSSSNVYRPAPRN
ncbi:hypothetical protein BFJ71_g4305 [Fusarium oxysporum]|nr:hypothetical protein BFJ71_g4305 [Fusarium oxysporum]